MSNATLRGGVIVVVMALVAGCGKAGTSSAGMAAGVTAAAVGGIAGAAAAMKKRPSLRVEKLGRTLEQPTFAYTNDVLVPVDRIDIRLPGAKRARRALQDRPRIDWGERLRSRRRLRDLLADRGLAQ